MFVYWGKTQILKGRDTEDLLVASVEGGVQVNTEKCQWGEFVLRFNVNN
jgi:hypothetical protein